MPNALRLASSLSSIFWRAAAYALLAPRDPPWLGVLRTMVTAYLLVSGIVFALIVSQASTRDYRVDVPWSDTLLHWVVPTLAVIAWTTDSIMAVNPPVPWSTGIVARGRA